MLPLAVCTWAYVIFAVCSQAGLNRFIHSISAVRIFLFIWPEMVLTICCFCCCYRVWCACVCLSLLLIYMKYMWGRHKYMVHAWNTNQSSNAIPFLAQTIFSRRTYIFRHAVSSIVVISTRVHTHTWRTRVTHVYIQRNTPPHHISSRSITVYAVHSRSKCSLARNK